MILELSELDHVDRFRRRGSDARSSDSLGSDNRASSEKVANPHLCKNGRDGLRQDREVRTIGRLKI
jgi:hypothetical protein